MTHTVQDLVTDFSALEKTIIAKLLRTNKDIRTARKECPSALANLKLVRREVDKLLSKTKITKCNLQSLTCNSDEIIFSFKNLYTEIRESYMRFN